MNENSLLINGYCHLVNKTFSFIQKYFDGVVPAGRLDQDIYWKTKEIYDSLEKLQAAQSCEEQVYENCFKAELAARVQEILEDYLRFATEYFEQGNPWKNRECDRRVCRNTVLNSVQMIANLTIWLELLEEYPAARVKEWLELDEEWQVHGVHSGYELPVTEELTLYLLKNTFQMA